MNDDLVMNDIPINIYIPRDRRDALMGFSEVKLLMVNSQSRCLWIISPFTSPSKFHHHLPEIS